MAGVPHHLMSYLEPTDWKYGTKEWRDDALKAIERIWKKNKIPIVAGGSASYIEALLYCKRMPAKAGNKIGREFYF
jgi:tRNA dimethylallyltransferase